MNAKETYTKKRFEECFSKYYRVVLSFISGYVADRDAAADLAQDVFLSLWKNRFNVDFDGDPVKYLFVLAKNKALNHLRKETSRDRYSKETLYLKALEASTPSVFMDHDVKSLREKALAELSESARETWNLSREKGLKYKEIAEIQGISIKTVEYRIARAMYVFRKHFKDYLITILGFFILYLFY